MPKASNLAEKIRQVTENTERDTFVDVPVTPPETPPEPAPENAEPSGGDFSFTDFSQFEGPVGEAEIHIKPKRGKLGPEEQDELADFFTEAGIGSIVARGFDAFFVSCNAEPLSVKEHNNMAKVVAYYCRVRFPTSASKYQPEILLAATFAFAVLPRIGPIAEKTRPWWQRLKEKLWPSRKNPIMPKPENPDE